jgi:hypothetical protein
VLAGLAYMYYIIRRVGEQAAMYNNITAWKCCKQYKRNRCAAAGKLYKTCAQKKEHCILHNLYKTRKEKYIYNSFTPLIDFNYYITYFLYFILYKRRNSIFIKNILLLLFIYFLYVYCITFLFKREKGEK